ncbi:MAG: efflux RND transporter periplasmic adaptor subunit [Deltaproteobacteria bacterium]|nr:MAG: efflux RND transporter periplasmic adaptor subunit [Deltaproteobacteria bacterium]
MKSIMRYTGTLALLCTIGLGLVGCKKPVAKQEAEVLSVNVATVQRGDMKESLSFTGDVNGTAEVKVYSTVSDRVKKLYVDAGATVKQGQRLAIVEHTRLRQAVSQAQAQIASTRSQINGANVGLSSAKIAARSARREYLRLQRLYKGGAVGSQQVDNAQTQYQSAQANVKSAKSQIRTLRANLRSLKASAGQAYTMSRSAIIRSPMDGVVARRYASQGDLATMQMPLFTIVQMDSVRIEIQVAEKDLPKVKLGKQATVTVVGQPGRTFVGRVVKVAPTLDRDTRTAPIEIEVPNVYFQPTRPSCRKDSDCSSDTYSRCFKVSRRRRACAEVHPLKPGMIATVKLLVKEHKDTLMLPAHALLNNSFAAQQKGATQTLSVLVVHDGKKVEERTIEVGLEQSGTVQVLSGLKVGEKVMVKGQNLYQAGSKIQVIKDETQTLVQRPKPVKTSAVNKIN